MPRARALATMKISESIFVCSFFFWFVALVIPSVPSTITITWTVSTSTDNIFMYAQPQYDWIFHQDDAWYIRKRSLSNLNSFTISLIRHVYISFRCGRMEISLFSCGRWCYILLLFSFLVPQESCRTIRTPIITIYRLKMMLLPIHNSPKICAWLGVWIGKIVCDSMLPGMITHTPLGHELCAILTMKKMVYEKEFPL